MTDFTDITKYFSKKARKARKVAGSLTRDVSAGIRKAGRQYKRSVGEMSRSPVAKSARRTLTNLATFAPATTALPPAMITRAAAEEAGRMAAEHLGKYRKHFSKSALWRKCRDSATAAGRKVLLRALQLYFASENPDMSTRQRWWIYGALGYLILPTDLVPDFIVGIGYADDLGVLVTVYETLSSYVGRRERSAATRQLREWGL